MHSDLTDRERIYLLEQMNRVSRSFALVAPRLEEPLDAHLALAYLLCRVLDNVEDCAQPFAWQEMRFAEFQRLLALEEDPSVTLTRWSALEWPGLTEDEVQMMGLRHGLMLWQIYARIPEATQNTIRHWVSEMAVGMSRAATAMHSGANGRALLAMPAAVPPAAQHVSSVVGPEPANKPRSAAFGNGNIGLGEAYFVIRDGVALPATGADYNEYCYYVAGTVGHMITELAIDHYRLNDQVAERLRATSESCGRALQKTNIIKDFVEDLRRGVCYLPEQWLKEENYRPLSLAGASLAWKGKVLSDVLRELAQSVTYLVALPYKAAGLRLAALLMMLPAYQTLFLAARRRGALFTAGHQIKISRPQMAQCISQSHALAGDNKAIQKYASTVEGRILSLMESDE